MRLHHCSKGRGQEDFNRLILENQVQSTSAAEEANLPLDVTVGGAADVPPLPPPSGDKHSKGGLAKVELPMGQLWSGCEYSRWCGS